MRGAYAPRIPITPVDVRDVAAAHLAAMITPKAGGQRFPLAVAPQYFIDVARALRQRYPDRRIPRLQMPDFVVRLYALFDSDVRDNLGELGYAKRLDATPSIALLGQPLISAEAAVLATAESLIQHGLV